MSNQEKLRLIGQTDVLPAPEEKYQGLAVIWTGEVYTSVTAPSGGWVWMPVCLGSNLLDFEVKIGSAPEKPELGQVFIYAPGLVLIRTLDGVRQFPPLDNNFYGKVDELPFPPNAFGQFVFYQNAFHHATMRGPEHFPSYMDNPVIDESEQFYQTIGLDKVLGEDLLSQPVIMPDVETSEFNETLNNQIAIEKPDKGILAKEKLMEVKRLKRRAMWYRFLLWVTWISVFSVVGYFGFQYAMENVKYGRYTDERSCKVSKGDFTVTGKRTYSYPYKSVFGYRLVDEGKVITETIVDVKGSAFSVMGLTDSKYWEVRVGMGEKGIAMLKPANTYIFSNDKVKIVATEGGFCNPIQRKLSDEELKAPEADVIK